MKIGVFAGDLFWSSCPYESLNVYEDVSEKYITDYIMFENDIRLNKEFSNNDKFFFDSEKFKKCKNIRIIKTWSDLYKISGEYSTILSRCKIAPKTRFPEDIKKRSKCPLTVWDVGGLDILTWESRHATNFLTKGKTWLKYLKKVNNSCDMKSAISLCPQYDPYYRKDLKHGAPISRELFFKKYNLDINKNLLLITPSNPGSHKDQFNQNLKDLEEITKTAIDNNFHVLVKTYPHDYVFRESQQQYSGIYKRIYTSIPQYEFIKQRIPEISIVESQDHYSAMLYSNKIFNMSGSSIAWETYFTSGVSYSINFSDKPYYKTVSYLPNDVIFPDDIFNINISSHFEIFQNSAVVDKEACSDFFTMKESSNIRESLKEILGY